MSYLYPTMIAKDVIDAVIQDEKTKYDLFDRDSNLSIEDRQKIMNKIFDHIYRKEIRKKKLEKINKCNDI